MFTFPPQTFFGKVVPKTRIQAHAPASRKIRDLFTSQVAEIRWAHKLSPETLHIPARRSVPEIQIFDITLKTTVIDDEVLHTIDRAIPYPVFHRIHSDTGTAISAAFKRPSAADPGQWVVGTRFTTTFKKSAAELPPLPTVLDLGHLYAALFAPLLPMPPRSGETLAAQIARCEKILRLRRQIDLLTSRLHREKQFNRKVALNQELNPLKAELEQLS